MPDARPLNILILGSERDELAIQNITTAVKVRIPDLSFYTSYLVRSPLDSELFLSNDLAIVFLSGFGWNEEEEAAINFARESGLPVINVLIGTASEKQPEFYRTYDYVDLRKIEESGMRELIRRIREFSSPEPLSQRPLNQFSEAAEDLPEEHWPDRDPEDTSGDSFDDIIKKMVDGSANERDGQFARARELPQEERSLLAARLRTEINVKYPPNQTFIASKRPPAEVVTIRSWLFSLLIFIDHSSNLSTSLLLSHLSPKIEPERHVRFWILSGLYWRQTSILEKAVEISWGDDASEVHLLARAIREQGSGNLQDRIGMYLNDGSEEKVWAALRVLRVIPLVGAAREVCDLLLRSDFETNRAYDALYALGSHEIMADAAVAFLSDIKAGILQTVRHIIRSSRGSSDRAITTFVRLLSKFARAEVDHILTLEEEDPEVRNTARSIRKMWEEQVFIFEEPVLEQDDGPADDNVSNAGLYSDTNDITQDLLDIRKDVQTLTAVIMAKEVEPPLAIGLFGDWGTGKSFFMASMEAAAKDLTERSTGPDSKFHTNVVHIWFNAWHYIDTNLWPSLVDKILTELQAYVAPIIPDKEIVIQLKSELKTAQESAEQIEAEKKQALEELSERETQLKKLKEEREERVIGVSDLAITDLSEVLAGDTALRDQLDESLDTIGIPNAVKNTAELSQVVVEAHSLGNRVLSIALALYRSNNYLFLIGGILAVLVVIPLASFLLIRLLSWDSLLATLSSLVAGFITITGIITATVRPAIRIASAALKKIEDAKQKVDEKIAEKRRQPSAEETVLERKIQELQGEKVKVEQRASDAAKTAKDLQARIDEIKDRNSLINFLIDRSLNYRQHLGLISTIRQDFDALEKKMEYARENPTSGLNHADRIILYIDDLDRCPADKVMEVLQAVHMLLAYKLFVVVVGVDPRWLLHSLEETYSAFKSGKPGADETLSASWHTTPQNYLEKIFQIPFNLKPMTPEGYGSLIKGLLSPKKRFGLTVKKSPQNVGALREPAVLAPGEVMVIDNKDITAVNEFYARSADEMTPLTGPDLLQDRPGPPETGTAPEPVFVVREDALVFHPWEVDFAERLFGLSSTPRSAKRFTNIYRILKAQVRNRDFAAFEGTEQAHGTFRLPMLLLAMLLHTPSECAKLFPKLLIHANNEDSKEMVIETLKNNTEFPMLAVKVLPFMETDDFPFTPDLLLEWVLRVSRFSFEVGRVVQTMTIRRIK